MALHYGVQILRPAWGYGSDVGGRRTPWIIGGMAVLALGGVGAAVATRLGRHSARAGLALAALSFLLVGVGVGAAGTSVLAMLATRVVPRRRAAAATTVWVMMIFGFAFTAPLAGHFLDPFSNMRLIVVTATVSCLSFIVASLASSVWSRDGSRRPLRAMADRRPRKPPFRQAFAQVWAEPAARRFTVFIFVSMLAYSAQELLVEPFAGLVFGMTPGVTTKLAGVQHGGVLIGMLSVAVAASLIGRPGTWILAILDDWRLRRLRVRAFVGSRRRNCGSRYPLSVAVFALGVSNGAFAVAAIGSMMGLAGSGAGSREGTRMGLWGAAQALAFGLGGLLGTVGVDVARHIVGSAVAAYGIVFVVEALLFIAAAAIAHNISSDNAPARQRAPDATSPAAVGI